MKKCAEEVAGPRSRLGWRGSHALLQFFVVVLAAIAAAIAAALAVATASTADAVVTTLASVAPAAAVADTAAIAPRIVCHLLFLRVTISVFVAVARGREGEDEGAVATGAD